MLNTPSGVGWSGVPEEIFDCATATPSANSVARCLSSETMMCSWPLAIGAPLSASDNAALPGLASESVLDFFSGFFSALVSAGLAGAAKGCPPKKPNPPFDADCVAAGAAFAAQAQSKAATDTPATNAARFIVRSPKEKRRL